MFHYSTQKWVTNINGSVDCKFLNSLSVLISYKDKPLLVIKSGYFDIPANKPLECCEFSFSLFSLIKYLALRRFLPQGAIVTVSNNCNLLTQIRHMSRWKYSILSGLLPVNSLLLG